LGQIITSAIGLGQLVIDIVGLVIDNYFGLVQSGVGCITIGYWAVGWISLSDEDNLYGWY
jgi:hypothetical protein